MVVPCGLWLLSCDVCRGWHDFARHKLRTAPSFSGLWGAGSRGAQSRGGRVVLTLSSLLLWCGVPRASIEPNFHDLYLKFINTMNSKPLMKEIVKATYENCRVRNKTARSSICRACLGECSLRAARKGPGLHGEQCVTLFGGVFPYSRTDQSRGKERVDIRLLSLLFYPAHRRCWALISFARAQRSAPC